MILEWRLKPGGRSIEEDYSDVLMQAGNGGFNDQREGPSPLAMPPPIA